jgi:hypothetical protein
MASYSTGNQVIPADTATKLVLPVGYGNRYLYLQARTNVDLFFGDTNLVTNSSINANLIKAGKERVICIAGNDEVWIYTAGATVDWALNSNIET